jgi:hypothetical protein
MFIRPRQSASGCVHFNLRLITNAGVGDNRALWCRHNRDTRATGLRLVEFLKRQPGWVLACAGGRYGIGFCKRSSLKNPVESTSMQKKRLVGGRLNQLSKAQGARRFLAFRILLLIYFMETLCSNKRRPQNCLVVKLLHYLHNGSIIVCMI